MTFASKEFILVFVPVFLVIYYLVPPKMRAWALLTGSVVFLAIGSWVNPALLLAAVLIHYIAGLLMGKLRAGSGRKALLALIVLLDAVLLVCFKWPGSPFLERFGLPLGISYYIFSMVTYLTDVYRGEVEAERSFAAFATYGFMFPKITQGPITKYGRVASALRGVDPGIDDLDEGLKRYAWGLILKVLLADKLAVLWNDIANAGYISISTPLAWLGAVAFSLQLYFDFYGYSQMAVGLGYMLGYRLPDNFDVPYASTGIREFYRRWHITLGRFFTEYVYIPLGGSRSGRLKTLRNIVIVWLLTALWHGFGANYLIWGMTLCVCVAVESMLAHRRGKETSTPSRLKRAWGHVYVSLVIAVTWICFALTDLNDLGTYLGRLFGILPGLNVNPQVFPAKCRQYGLYLLVGILLASPLEKKLFEKAKSCLWGMAVLAALFWIAVYEMVRMGSSPFMYLNF